MKIKNFIAITVVLLTGFVSKAQISCQDSLNIRQYEDRYYYPAAVTGGCYEMPLDLVIINEMGVPEYHLFPYCCSVGITNIDEWLVSEDSITNCTYDYAQPYVAYTTPLRIAGVSGYISIRDPYNFVDSLGQLNSYYEIRDGSLENVLAKVEIARNSTRNVEADAPLILHETSRGYTELFFDSVVSVLGDFYVVLHTPDTISYENVSGRNIWQSMGYVYSDEPCANERYPMAKMRAHNSVWYTIKEMYDDYGQVLNVRAFYLFPILAEDDTISTLSDPDLERFVRIFPNPVNEEVNINCGYRIKSLQIIDQAGRIVRQAEPGANNYKCDLRGLANGVYMVTLTTNRGTITKKIVKQERQ